MRWADTAHKIPISPNPSTLFQGFFAGTDQWSVVQREKKA
jgi:hypothetical protein